MRRHVNQRIRRNWPRVAITQRGDGHYGTPEVTQLLENMHCSYILGLPGNARLTEIAWPWCEDVATRRATRGKAKIRRFFQTTYAAKSWSYQRRVIVRVEATSWAAAFDLSQPICKGVPSTFTKKLNARGRVENLLLTVCQQTAVRQRIKEHKLYAKTDRTSCHRWQANQFRLQLHTAAYWLLHQLRGVAPKRSRWRTATFETRRGSFLKSLSASNN